MSETVDQPYLEALRNLAASSGWTVVDARERPLNTAFSLKRWR